MQVWLIKRQSDFTEGRGHLEIVPNLGAWLSEQEAWDSINNFGGVQGTHPSKFDFGLWKDIDNWQQFKEKHGWPGDYDVIPVTICMAKPEVI